MHHKKLAKYNANNEANHWSSAKIAASVTIIKPIVCKTQQSGSFLGRNSLTASKTISSGLRWGKSPAGQLTPLLIKSFSERGI